MKVVQVVEATASASPSPSEAVVKMNSGDLIVFKTNASGVITYVNKMMCDYSGYTEKELLGQSRDMIIHSDTPKAISYLMREHLSQEQEFFFYLKNLRKDGGYFWAFANIAPVYEGGKHIGYISSRRCPSSDAIKVIEPLYQAMLEKERSLSKEQQIPMSSAILWQAISKEFMSYAEFILSL